MGNIMVWEISQTQKDQVSMLSHICGIGGQEGDSHESTRETIRDVEGGLERG
jgi:hypothetical protein